MKHAALFKVHSMLTGKKASFFAGQLLSFLLVSTLVLAQAVSLSHSHEGDVRHQVDCEICLKVGSSDDMLVAHPKISFAEPALNSYSELPLRTSYSVVRTATARAPPLA